MNKKKASETQQSKKFLYFEDPVEREVLVGFIDRAVEYVHKNKIGVVVTGGSSAQPLLYLFRALWRKRYPDERISFFTLPGVHIGMRTPEEIKALIERYRKTLATKLKNNEPVFLLEETVTSGETIRKIKRAFRNMGAENTSVGCLGAPGATSAGKRKKIMKMLGIDVLGKLGDVPSFHSLRRMYIRRARRYSGIRRREALRPIKQLRHDLKLIANEAAKKRGMKARFGKMRPRRK